MKAVMYHYVRPGSPKAPHLRHLHLDDFKQQLDYFERHFSFVSQDDFISSFETGVVPKGVVLTFDDGFKDHYSYVLPELTGRGLWGIFYVPALPYIKRRLLDVHCVHLLLGMFGGRVISEALQRHLQPHMIIPERVKEFESRTYQFHNDDEVITETKRIFNYYLSAQARKEILDALFEEFGLDEEELVRDFYMTPSELQEMQHKGMIIGSHTVSHRVMSTLSRKEQEQEIGDSFDTLNRILLSTSSTYCHPYGGDHSFNNDTKEILKNMGCTFAFSVEPRDVTLDDIHKRPYALPRYDCNRFPHGRAKMHG